MIKIIIQKIKEYNLLKSLLPVEMINLYLKQNMNHWLFNWKNYYLILNNKTNYKSLFYN